MKKLMIGLLSVGIVIALVPFINGLYVRNDFYKQIDDLQSPSIETKQNLTRRRCPSCQVKYFGFWIGKFDRTQSNSFTACK